MAGLPPDEVVRLLDKRTERLRIELGALDAAERIGEEIALPEVFAVESRFRHAMLSAELAFVTDVAARIRAGTFGGTKLWRRIHELRAEGLGFEEIMSDPVSHLGEEARILRPEPPSQKQN